MMPQAEGPLAELLSGACVLLEDRLSPAAPAQLFSNPLSIVACTDPADLGACLADIEHGLSDGLHAAGLLSYELGHALEPKLRGRLTAERNTPLLWFGLFKPPQSIPPPVLDEAFARLGPPSPIEDLQFGHDLATHVSKVGQILALIRSGDIYQGNLTFPVSFQYNGDPLQLYAALRSRQPVSFGGYARLGDSAVLSVSPELWVRVSDNIATTRPMKGTCPRGADAPEDAALRQRLQDDPKQRAENLMIVDLLRNDLSRIAEVGSVSVPSLFEVETYPGFHAMSSTVTASLRNTADLRDIFAALFPCGSIVGAPKIRAAEILDEMEAGPRGFYTGALGAIAPSGDMRFNVAIRTAVIDRRGRGTYGVGGGIVADSQPADEYEEALLKARVLTGLAEPYDLIETFRWQPGGFIRLLSHLDRLGRSAAQLGFSCARGHIEEQLATFAKAELHHLADPHRVRLVLRRDGCISITTTALPTARPGKLQACIAATRLDPGDPFLRHKTSLRSIYETAYDHATAAGLDEAVFLNTSGDIAEASRNTVFVEIDGKLRTPPLSCGVLPGVLRQTLIAAGEATEQQLSLGDLAHASAWFLGNSLYGLREAVLVQ